MKDSVTEFGLLSEIIENITENADEIFKMKDKTDYNNGQLMAYASVLDIIKDTLSGYDIDKFNLNYDIEKKYLC